MKRLLLGILLALTVAAPVAASGPPPPLVPPLSLDLSGPPGVHRMLTVPDEFVFAYEVWGRDCHAHMQLGDIFVDVQLNFWTDYTTTAHVYTVPGTYALDLTGGCHWKLHVEWPLP